MTQLAREVLVSRTHEYLRRYQPRLIGMTGSAYRHLAAAALAAVTTDEVRLEAGIATSLDETVRVILGDRHHAPRGLLSRLMQSRVHELGGAPPEAIALELTPTMPGVMDDIAREFPMHTGLITDIGSGQLDLFDRVELVAHEMLSLLVTLPKDGHAVLNGDDPLVRALESHVRANMVWYGSTPDCQVQLSSVRPLAEYRHRYEVASLIPGVVCEVRIYGKPYELRLPHIIFAHHALAIIGGLATASTLPLNLSRVLHRLSQFRPPAGWGCLTPGVEGSYLIDESAQATPESMCASLRALGKLPVDRRLAILGDLPDLGNMTTHWYREIGTQAGKNAQVVILVGDHMRAAGASAVAAGADVHHFETSAEVSGWLVSYLHAGDVALVSGGADTRLQQAVEKLSASTNA